MGDTTEETFEQASERMQMEIGLAQAMQRLQSNTDFVKLFDEGFIQAFAVTNTYNIATMNHESRARVHEKMVARSHFVQYCQGIIQSGNIAASELRELNESQDGSSEE